MKLENIDHVAIIGTGMIGSSMAVLFAGNGYQTTMFAVDDENAAHGRKLFDAYYADLVEHGAITKEEARRCSTYLNITQDWTNLADADFIFECVFEDLSIKHDVYAHVEENCTNLRAIVSSTSSIPANKLTDGLEKYSDRLLVAHPFNPPHLVPFVEVLRADLTSDAATDFAIKMLESVGRQVAIVLKSAPGFIGNRLQHALLREAFYMVQEGITTIDGVEKALTYGFGPRYTSVGLFQHQDYAGLDLVQSIEKNIFPTLCNASAPQQILNNAIAHGDLGMKTGKGIHEWSDVTTDEFREAESKPYYQFFNWSLPEVDA